MELTPSWIVSPSCQRASKPRGFLSFNFLMAYVYYQMGRTQEAKVAIDTVWKKVPSSASVNLFRKAINPR